MHRLILLAVSTALLFHTPAMAQAPAVEARAGSVTGQVFVSSGPNRFPLTPGYTLNPGNVVDTRSGGRVVIDLSDGSIVIVEPGSLIIIKDIRAAGSLRELFDITLGKVRVKINHYLGRPNPYRMNSPTASIAVRGTDFSIEVEATGDTKVVVFEGVVEVSSLANPSHRVLVEAGRGILVHPGQELRPFSPEVAGDSGERGRIAQGGSERRDESEHGAPQGGTQLVVQKEIDEDSSRSVASAYERYIASLTELGQLPFLMRFNAFPERHLDSLENPAYATAFGTGEGRVIVLPLLRGSQEPGGNSGVSGPVSQPLDYAIAPQVSLFTPLKGSRWFVGGSLAASRARSGAATTVADLDTSPAGGTVINQRLVSGSATSTYYSGSATLARKVGDGGRTSAGLSVENLRGTGTLLSTTIDADTPGSPLVDLVRSRSGITQTRFTAGVSRDFAGYHKLGLFYRYGFIRANDDDTFRTVGGIPTSLDSQQSRGHSSELGLRLRGPLSQRLFYGAQASWTGVSLYDKIERATIVDSDQRDYARRASASVGFGYVLKQRTLISMDFAGGVARTRASRFEDATGAVLQTGTTSNRFFSSHIAVQSGVWRRLFVTGSFLLLAQSHSLSSALFPDTYGSIVRIGDAFLPLSTTTYQAPGRSSDFGAGWRFSPNAFAQYVFSTGYGFCPSSHTLMLRYTFRLRKQ